MKITILGAGMMGSAMAIPLADSGHDVALVSALLDDAILARLQADGVHPGLSCALPDNVTYHHHADAAEPLAQAEGIVSGVSSPGVVWAAERIGKSARPGTPVVAITKGLDAVDSGLRILPDLLDATVTDAGGKLSASAAIAGPCIAGELARRVPSAVVLAGRDPSVCAFWQGIFDVDYYHVRVSTDPVGTEYCAALKNAYALGVGMVAGIHERHGGSKGSSVAFHNLESSVYTQALQEMALLVTGAGGDAGTVLGLAGAGDLLVTLNGGRTSRFGRWLGLGLSLPDAIDHMAGATLECLDILDVLATNLSADTLAQCPLATHLIDVALKGEPVDFPVSQFHRRGN